MTLFNCLSFTKTKMKIYQLLISYNFEVKLVNAVCRFCHEAYDHDYKATIGVDFEVERFDIMHTPFNIQM